MDCPICCGPAGPLGGLGNLVWFVCRDCGMQFNVPVSEIEQEAPDEEEEEE